MSRVCSHILLIKHPILFSIEIWEWISLSFFGPMVLSRTYQGRGPMVLSRTYQGRGPMVLSRTYQGWGPMVLSHTYQGRDRWFCHVPTKGGDRWCCHVPTKGEDTEIPPPKLRLSEHTDMTVHWKAIEEHFLMAPVVFRFNHFRGRRMHFLDFPQNSFFSAFRSAEKETWTSSIL
jgi:hypothetical protein